ncbi:MAG: hypothetical protein H6905_07905 [Hyphomicrobiales bacterium]|nr:hypothetical protein [Hyphomicrobiales bacterium]
MNKNFAKELVSEFILPLMCISAVFAFAAFWPFEFSSRLSTTPSTTMPSVDSSSGQVVSPATILNSVPELPTVVPSVQQHPDGVQEASGEQLDGIAAVTAENS